MYLEKLEIASDDPVAEYLANQRTLLAIPLYDGGHSINMVVLARRQQNGFAEHLRIWPEWVAMGNLFGLTRRISALKKTLADEFTSVSEIQRSLLPSDRTSGRFKVYGRCDPAERAGGDYYDILQLTEGRCGVLIADVKGHGAPAAYIMAIMHTIVHTHLNEATDPGRFLAFLNRQLHEHYFDRLLNRHGELWFVTAWYAVHDPSSNELEFASAGHPPARLRLGRDGTIKILESNGGPMLGLSADQDYATASWTLERDDYLVIFTDGIPEAKAPSNEQFGEDRLNAVLAQRPDDAVVVLNKVFDYIATFTENQQPDDDRTLVVASFT